MRPNTRWTRVRFRLVRYGKRLEILAAPVLGGIAMVLGFIVAWVLLVVFAIAAISFYLAALLFERKDRRIPGRYVYVRGRTVSEIAEKLTTDERFTRVKR